MLVDGEQSSILPLCRCVVLQKLPIDIARYEQTEMDYVECRLPDRQGVRFEGETTNLCSSRRLPVHRRIQGLPKGV